MAAFKRFGGLEVLQIADSVARSKGISKECVLNALEEGIKVAARQKYGKEQSIKVTINRSNGDIGIYKGFVIVERHAQPDPESGSYLLACDDRFKGKDVEIGSIIYERIPPPEIARLAAQSAKNVISSKIREEERKVEYNEFCGRIGDIIGGIVDRIERGNIIIRVGSSEAIIRRSALLRTDEYKQGDRVRACLDNLDPQAHGPQLVLSRTSNQFLSKLISLEVPEVMDGIIDIVSVARDPSSRAKVAVYSKDKAINPVGSCIGIKGNRIKSVMNELKGEKIDLVEWTADVGQMIINAFAPIPVLKVLLDEERRSAEVIVSQDCQSAAIGRGGQNVRLVSDLLGYRIDVMTEETESRKRAEEFNNITKMFEDALDLSGILAQLLASEGFTSIEEIAVRSPSELCDMIQGLEEGVAHELVSRAQEYCTSELATAEDDVLLRIDGMTSQLSQKFRAAGVVDIRGVADLSKDDFIDIVPEMAKNESAVCDMIMQARNIINK